LFSSLFCSQVNVVQGKKVTFVALFSAANSTPQGGSNDVAVNNGCDPGVCGAIPGLVYNAELDQCAWPDEVGCSLRGCVAC